MVKFGNKVYRNLQEQVLENANDIELLKKKVNDTPVIKYYHKALLTVSSLELDFHFYHSNPLALTKDQFIEYIKKVKNINLDFNDKNSTSGGQVYYYLSLNWPIADEDVLELKSIGYSNSNLASDNRELTSDEWSFEDEVIEI